MHVIGNLRSHDSVEFGLLFLRRKVDLENSRMISENESQLPSNEDSQVGPTVLLLVDG